MTSICWPGPCRFALVPGAKKRNLSRQAQYGPATCGQYDPILHTWIAPPDEKAWRERERQHQHEAGCLSPISADHDCIAN